jgi:hypothetical protein
VLEREVINTKFKANIMPSTGMRLDDQAARLTGYDPWSFNPVILESCRRIVSKAF